MDLIVSVKQIKGHCPTHKLGDSFTLKAGYQLVSDGPVCMHALASLMPYYNALRVSEPAQWGLEGKEDKTKAYIQCPDPCEYTSGGTVVLEIAKTS
ncbi:MAG: TIGR04076 family protein [Phycisphaerales bacterium]|nr:MAG: TIGR04076 family protein [Phycisphaerales bacterium]